MAHSLSAKKRIRQNERRAAVNKARISRIRTFVRRVESALAAGDYEAARAAFHAAEPEIRRGVTKRVLKLNTASREVSRLSRGVKALSPDAKAAA